MPELSNEQKEILSNAITIFSTGIEVDGGISNFYLDAEKIASHPEGRNFLKEKHRKFLIEDMKERKIGCLMIPEDYAIRAPSMLQIMEELSIELNLPLKIPKISDYVTPRLIEKFQDKMSEEDLGHIKEGRIDLARLTIEPGQVQPPHRHKTFIELVRILGGFFRKNGRFYAFGHNFMLKRREIHSYDNTGFDRPLEIFAVCIPKYEPSDLEYIN